MTILLASKKPFAWKMASSTVVLKIMHRNTGNVARSYVRDDERLESLRFSKNLIEVIFLKVAQKAAKILYCHMRSTTSRWINSFSNSIVLYNYLLPWRIICFKALVEISIICVGEPLDRHLNRESPLKRGPTLYSQAVTTVNFDLPVYSRMQWHACIRY